MQQRTRDCHVTVDAGEGGADGADRLGHAEAVLEQAMRVGLVVVLGGRRRPIASPELAALAEYALQQDAQVRLLNRLQQLSDLTLHLLDAASGAVAQVRRIEATFRRSLQTSQVDLRAEARVHRAVAQQQAQIHATVAAPAAASRTSRTCSISWPSVSSFRSMAPN
jgi:hypothetical protein